VASSPGLATHPVSGRKVVVAYLIRRLLNAVVTLLVVTLVTFGVFFLVPKATGSDPALLYIGKQADPVAVEGIRTKLGLGDPILVQYGSS